MRPIIGIIGGAGPMAGLSLVQRIVSRAQARGCKNDADFPEIILWSVPFADMLSPGQESQVTRQLQRAIDGLAQAGVTLIALACNTLHSYLSRCTTPLEILEITNLDLPTPPLVLCTSAARQARLHTPCSYPSPALQTRVDDLIDRVLAGQSPSDELAAICQAAAAPTILLGCTELSLLTNPGAIDPLDLLADRLTQRIFK